MNKKKTATVSNDEKLEAMMKNVMDKLESIQNDQSQKIDKISEKQEQMLSKFESIQQKLEGRKRGRIGDDDGNKAKRMDIGEKDEGKDEKEPKDEKVDEQHRKIIVKAVFKNVTRNLGEGQQNYSPIEEHNGIPWSICIQNKDGFLGVFFHCKRNEVSKPWSIEFKCTIKIMKSDGTSISNQFDYCFQKSEGRGYLNFMEWDEMKKECIQKNRLVVETHFDIIKTTGIYPKNLRDFDDPECSDIILSVKNQKFYVAKFYLAAQSPYFKALFLGQFQDSSKDEIELKGIDPYDFQKFLEVLYGSNSIDETTVEGILSVADMYDTPTVIEKCERFLLEKSTKAPRKKLQMAVRYQLENLKKKVMEGINTKDEIRAVVPADIHDMDIEMFNWLLQKSLNANK